MEEWLLWAGAAAFCVFALSTLLLKKGKIPSYISFAGCLLVIGALLLRWYTLGRPPWATLYETAALLALATGVASAYCYRLKETPALYLPLAAVAIVLLVFSAMSWEANPSLSPALESGWLLIHVPVVILAYAALSVASIASGALIALKALGRGDDRTIKRLDSIAYNLIIAGLALLVLGIVMGAMWAKAAWGAYWSWDPKETWSLITALVYAAYPLARRAGMKPEDSAFIALLGLLAILFTYLGVSYLIPGLHSYA
ncbi:MAG TPA: cytochrome c biogenesis protein CcsA [Methanocella sp.]|uniref:cytochrome c biogenesis protein CcsA n=1 Tax=Methanocella sp. TaxID=2052833 RepID=UPI002CE6FCCE|nr:cytochrome c biogenesis protein CcsA [Methanocella sp.]HTY90179.1 cytochrome c biogenesis protein CcsA [Methanocella sp.]